MFIYQFIAMKNGISRQSFLHLFLSLHIDFYNNKVKDGELDESLCTCSFQYAAHFRKSGKAAKKCRGRNNCLQPETAEGRVR